MHLTGMFFLAGLQFDMASLPQQLVNGVMLGAVYALIALGYTMVYGVLRLINFAHGDVYMLGAFIALFVSQALGFTPNTDIAQGHLWGMAIDPIYCLLIMLTASMFGCALIGMVIERFAYRPMRRHSRIASLITAIGVSLLLEYGGQLVLPVNPPPSISEKVNSFRETPNHTGKITLTLVPPPASLATQAASLEPAYKDAKAKLDDYIQKNHADSFNLPPEGQELQNKAQNTEREYKDVLRKLESSGTKVIIQYSQIIVFVVSLALMAMLTVLVKLTPAGRAMRAVSLDFDSASLMGISVDKVVTWTFLLGSALAGAGAMMTATFFGTPLTAFFGVTPGVKAFVAAVLGGIGNIPGAVLGGLLMGVAENLVVWLGYSSYRDAVAFVILIAVLMFKPGGLLGSAKVEKV